MNITSRNIIDDFVNIIAAGNEPDMKKKYHPLVTYKLNKNLTPDVLKKYVLQSEKIRKLIDYYAKRNKSSIEKLNQVAKYILDEIALDRNMAVIRWCGVFITHTTQRICTGIYINERSINKIKTYLGPNPVLYLPNHRSYMDFILLSYIFFHYNIEIPGIAAGMDFHEMFMIGKMMRKTGAFFMRRTFSHNDLYWDIFGEYVSALMTVYNIGLEFFIEGTRSRSLKTLVPKIGLLSMALLPYFTGIISDVTIIPISISYDRILEEELFVYELLGAPKPKESTKGFFKSLKILNDKYGRMYIDFCQPISVKEFLCHKNHDRINHSILAAHLQNLNKDEIDELKNLSLEVVFQQQKRIVIHIFNLLCLFYSSQLYNGNYIINIDELEKGIRMLINIFEELGATIFAHVNNLKKEIIETLEVHSNIMYLKEDFLYLSQLCIEKFTRDVHLQNMKAHSLLPQTMAVSVPSLLLQLYINPCLFWLVRPAYIILAAMYLNSDQHVRLYKSEVDWDHNKEKDLLFNHFTELDNIFKYEFIFNSMGNQKEFEENLKILHSKGILITTTDSFKIKVNQNDLCRIILSAFVPYLFLYYQLVIILNTKFPDDQIFDKKSVLKNMQEYIEELILYQHKEQHPGQDYCKHVHPYCLALDSINIALYSFVKGNYLIKNGETDLLQRSKLTQKSLQELEKILLGYCKLIPFTQYTFTQYTNFNSKL